MFRRLVFFLLIGSLSWLLSCKTDSTAIDDTIHVRIAKDPERLHPLIFPNPLAREIYQYVFLPLADYNTETLELEPLLITNIPEKEIITEGPYAGGVQYKIEIRPEAVWENGSPVTAKDYEFTLKAVRLPLNQTSRYREALQNIARVDIDPANPRKFTVTLYKDEMNALETVVQWEIYPAYFYDPENVLASLDLTSLSQDTMYEKKVMADSAFIQFAEAFNGQEFSSQKISGSGPYSFKTWESNQFIVLEKKADYWGEQYDDSGLKNNPDKIIFHMIPDDVAAMVQLKSGAIDVMNQVNDDDYLALQKDPESKDKFHFFTPSLTKYYVILLNNGDPLLQDKNVRKALAHLVDVDYILNGLENGFGERLTTPIHPTKPYYDKSLQPIAFNQKKAVDLLDSSGWADKDNNGIREKMIGGSKKELTLDIYISGQELGNQVALLLQQHATKAGIKINIIEKEFKQIRAEHIKTRNYHLIPSVVSTDLNAWEDLRPRYHSEFDNASGGNEISYHNQEADILLDSIPMEKDAEKRKDLYRKLQKIFYEDQPMIFLYVPAERIIVNKIWKAQATQKRPGYAVNTFELIGQRTPQ